MRMRILRYYGVFAIALSLVGCEVTTQPNPDYEPSSCVSFRVGALPDQRIPLFIGNAHANPKCPGYHLAIAEIRGWIRSINDACNAKDPDFSMEMTVDTSWAVKNGIDLDTLFNVGNIVSFGFNKGPGASPLAMISDPELHLEIWGFRPTSFPDASRPRGWLPTGAESLGKCGDVMWPYDPLVPHIPGPALKPGQYVKVVGSIVSDSAHIGGTKQDQENAAAYSCRYDGFFCDWDSNVAEREAYMVWGDESTWTEIHPPDSIEVLADSGSGPHPSEAAPSEEFRAVAVAADNCLIGPCEANMVETDIFPAGPKPPGGTLAYQEIVGKSTNVATIEIGNASHSGAAIQVFPDHIHIKVKVRGQPALGLPGKFKAFYRVFWKSP